MPHIASRAITMIPLVVMFTIVSWAAGADSLEAGDERGVHHAEFIAAWDETSLARGEQIYATMCMPCHGTPQHPGTLPTSRAFWKEPFKNGTDPLSLYRTLSHGLGQMPAWPFLAPEQRYDAIHYVREAFLRTANPAAYFEVTPAYLDSLPKPEGDFQKTAAMLEFEKGPPYLRMDFGPVLFWTVQVASNNIAYKGIAVRLDEGPGGISKGKAWMLYDHDTLRLAAAWSGEGFIDWKGIAFDGSHQTHASIVGDVAFTNPVGPGWAQPGTSRFEDPRLRGRDNRPYGPLPHEWAHFKGAYLNGRQVVLRYSVGDADILESPGCETSADGLRYLRAFEIGKSSRDLVLRVAPSTVSATVAGSSAARLFVEGDEQRLAIPAAATPLKLTVRIAPRNVAGGTTHEIAAPPGGSLKRLLRGGARRWETILQTQGILGRDDAAFAVDEITTPANADNPWKTWMRYGGFDFFADGRRAAIATWNGDVWIVDGIEGDLRELRWQRSASGLFQPLGVRILDDVIHVGCRDQIVKLHDFNGDGEADYYENFNNDHQVTEHFHEFAMGLQTDRAGNFYYAKSARHALPPLVPHHGTLLRVRPDGAHTDIVASGFRAANGVCVNEDGTFFVTDQEGHWTPKNRINWVRPGKFYGNMWSYHAPESSANDAMEPPLVWIINQKDRSPGELVRVTSESWGPLQGRLLNLSYGTGRIFLVPHEMIDGRPQGGVVELPILDFPTGVMRGRFHPGNGHLYACGMFAWAGNQTRDGGFYRVRYLGKPAWLPISLQALPDGMRIEFSDPVSVTSASRADSYTIRVWGLKRTANYGSALHHERMLKVEAVLVSADGRRVDLKIPELQPTWGMEIKCQLEAPDGTPFVRVIHNTIHTMGTAKIALP